jgi:hypothetical protein
MPCPPISKSSYFSKAENIPGAVCSLTVNARCRKKSFFTLLQGWKFCPLFSFSPICKCACMKAFLTGDVYGE